MRRHTPATVRALVIVTILAAFVSCSIETPQSPRWDINLTLPLVDHEYDMIEIIDRISEDALTYDSTGSISFTIEEDIDCVDAEAGLVASGLSDSYTETMGNMEINAPDPVDSRILLSDHIPSGGFVPPMAIDAGTNFPVFDDVVSAVIESATMVIRVTNNLGLPLDTLTLEIRDEIFDARIGYITFTGGLEKEQTGSRAIVLSGVTVSNSFSFEAHMHTPGDTLDSVTGKSLDVEASFYGDISVSSATAAIPAQVKTWVEEITLEEDNTLISATVRTGSLRLEVSNGTSVPAIATLVVPAISSGGSPLTITAGLPPGQTQILNRDLAGFTIQPTVGPDGQTFTVEMTADVPSSGSEILTVDASHMFSIDVTVSSLELSSMSGIIDPETIVLDPAEISVDVPEGFENFGLTGAVMELEIVSTAGFPAGLELILRTDDGREKTITGTIQPGVPGDPVTTLISEDDLTAILNPVPLSISVSGTAQVGDGSTQGTISEESYVCGSVTISSPLDIIVGDTDFETDVSSTEMEADDIRDLTDRMKEATLTANVINHLPLEVSVTIYLSGDSLTVFDDPELIIGPLEVFAGDIGVDGLVSAVRTSENIFQLTSDDLQILEHETIYIGQSIEFPGTSGLVVRIVDADWITIQAYMDITLTVGEE